MIKKVKISKKNNMETYNIDVLNAFRSDGKTCTYIGDI